MTRPPRGVQLLIAVAAMGAALGAGYLLLRKRATVPASDGTECIAAPREEGAEVITGTRSERKGEERVAIEERTLRGHGPLSADVAARVRGIYLQETERLRGEVAKATSTPESDEVAAIEGALKEAELVEASVCADRVLQCLDRGDYVTCDEGESLPQISGKKLITYGTVTDENRRLTLGFYLSRTGALDDAMTVVAETAEELRQRLCDRFNKLPEAERRRRFELDARARDELMKAGRNISSRRRQELRAQLLDERVSYDRDKWLYRAKR